MDLFGLAAQLLHSNMVQTCEACAHRYVRLEGVAG